MYSKEKAVGSINNEKTKTKLLDPTALFGHVTGRYGRRR